MNKLRRIRMEHGYNLLDVAKKVNISKAYYCQIENGKRNLYYSLAIKIASVFNMKPDDIFYDDHIK